MIDARDLNYEHWCLRIRRSHVRGPLTRKGCNTYCSRYTELQLVHDNFSHPSLGKVVIAFSWYFTNIRYAELSTHTDPNVQCRWRYRSSSLVWKLSRQRTLAIQTQKITQKFSFYSILRAKRVHLFQLLCNGLVLKWRNKPFSCQDTQLYFGCIML